MILEEFFEPTVIFFGPTNFPVILQIMINEILQNLINTEKVISFINNIIVEMKEKEEHNEMVKVVKRLAENDLYIKLRKIQVKVREVGFLEVVIGLGEIKIKKGKMKEVLD